MQPAMGVFRFSPKNVIVLFPMFKRHLRSRSTIKEHMSSVICETRIPEVNLNTKINGIQDLTDFG